MEEAKIYNLAARYFSGEASPEEISELESLKLDPENARIFSDLEQVWADSSAWAPDFSSEINQEWEKLNSRISESKPKFTIVRNFKFYSIAASLLLALGISLVFWFNTSNNVYTTNDLAQVFELPDGSKITLQPHSKVELSDDFNENKRELKLNGTAFFDVKRDENKAFIINTEFSKTEVLGTSFYLSAPKNSSIRLSVKTGLVYFENTLQKTGLKVAAGEKAEIHTKELGPEKVINEQETFMPAEQGFIKFEKAELNKVVSEMSRLYGLEIRINDVNMQQCLFTGKFEAEKQETAIKMLAELYQFKVEQNNNTILLSGGQCR